MQSRAYPRHPTIDAQEQGARAGLSWRVTVLGATVNTSLSAWDSWYERGDMVYLNKVLIDPTPQSEPLPNMVQNSAGGNDYPVDDMTRSRLFLILGSEGESYHAD